MLVGWTHRPEEKPHSWSRWGQDLANTFKEDTTAPGLAGVGAASTMAGA